MQVSPKTAAAVLAAAVAVGMVLPLPGGNGSHPAAVHALAVPAAQLAGPCEGAPALDADTLAMFFAPAVAKGDPAPVAIIDAHAFTVTYGGATYTVSVPDGAAPTVSGPDAPSADLLARHVGLCVGAVMMTPADAPGQWTDGGTYVAAGNAPAADR